MITLKYSFLILMFFYLTFYAFASDNPYINSGLEYYKDGKLDRARDEYNKALKYYQEQNDHEGVALSYLRLSEVYSSLGLYKKALECCDKATRENPSKNLTGEILIKKGDYSLAMGSYENALNSYEDALKMYEQSGDKHGKGIALEHRGDAYYELLLYEKALANHKDSLACFIETGDTRNRAVLLCKIGEDYFTTGEKEYGLQKLQESLDVAKKDPSISYDILMRTGSICREYGYPEKALARYREARDVSNERGEKLKEKKALAEIAGIHLMNKNDETALSVYEEVMRLSEEGGDRGGKIDALFNMAEIYDRHSLSDKALSSYKDCLDFYKSVGNKWGSVKTSVKLGEFYEKNNQTDLAAKHYTEAIAGLEEMRGEIKTKEIKESFSEKAMPIYRKVINFFLKTGKEKDAFNYLEMSRARSLLDALLRGNVDIQKGAGSELLEADKRLQAEITFLENTFSEEMSRIMPDQQRVKDLQEQLNTCKRELMVIRERLIATSPSYAFLTGIKKPLSLEEIQKILKPDQYVLEYFVNTDRLNVWVISKNSFKIIEIPLSVDELEKKIELFRKPLKELVNADTTAGFKQILSGFDYQNLKELHDMLFKPLLDKVAFPPESELIVVPDGVLYYIPFEALISNMSGPRYIIEDYNILYVPSSSTLDPAVMGGDKKTSGLYLGFGNPSFGTSGKTSPVTQSTVDTDMEISVTLQGFSLAPLPNTETEVKNIESFFKSSGKTSVYLRDMATESTVKKECSNYKYLLFATHGLLDERNPMDSSLAFTSEKGDDGFLKASEILNLNLNADLVTLSACETGLGKIKSGEGVVGLTRAFMYAGTPSIVVSLWSVESGSTAKMMEIFFKNLISSKNKAKALRQAKLSIMKEGDGNFSYGHPFFWAPFILVGKSN